MVKVVVALGSILVGATFTLRFYRQQHKKRSSRISKEEKKTADVTKGEPRIGIIGDIFMDVVVGGIKKFPDWGMDELTQSPIKLMPGGGGLNSALILGGLQQACGSGSVELHSLIGYDKFGDVVRNRVHGTRVSLIYTEEAARRVSTGICVCFSGGEEGKMDRAFITYRGAMAAFNGDDLDIDQLQRVSHVHIAGYYNFPKMWSALSSIVPALKKKNITVSCNPQWDASEEWRGLADLYNDLDYLIMNEDEAFQLTRQAKLGDALEKFHSQGLKMAIVTIGAKGAVASIREYHSSEEDSKKKKNSPVVRWYWHKAKNVSEVLDTTGAGDAFTGGYLFEWSRSGDVRKALQMGCAVGSAMVTKLGASATLTLDDIRGYMCSDCLSEESAPSNSVLQHIAIGDE